MCTEASYLGHIITRDGVKPKLEKVKAVQGFSIPKDQKEIKSFLGLAGYYRKCVKDFAKIVIPLTQLLKNGIKFSFDENCIKAINFNKSSNSLISRFW